MSNSCYIFLSVISLVFAAQAYSGEEVPKFTDEDLHRYDHAAQASDGTGANVTVSPRKQDVAGTWKFVCCDGKYWGEIDLSDDERSKITGRFYDLANKSGGTIDGTVTGKSVQFTRNNGKQDYKLTLSDDGNTMSGFFVGAHDGSAGTEITMTRGDALPPAGDAFTQWREAEIFGKEMDIFWKNGFYPAVVEGRSYQGKNQFRARVQPFPKKAWWFYWWYDQQPAAYEEHKKNMIAEGFQEINLQVFTDSSGVKKYQTCWIKYGK